MPEYDPRVIEPGHASEKADDVARDDAVVILVPHTHWDREWYRTAESFRIGLVSLVDEVLDDPGPEPFVLDGQSVTIADYLDVPPERRDDLPRALASGALEAGPWFVLADLLIPSGEALLRNLHLGSAVLRDLGVDPPPVWYAPDSFGHPAAAPVMAHGFGLTVGIVWRGYGGRHWPAGDTVRWRSVDGSELLTHHLPPSGYEFASSLPVTAIDAKRRWQSLSGVLKRRANGGVMLLLNGADHHARQDKLAAAIQELRAQ